MTISLSAGLTRCVRAVWAVVLRSSLTAAGLFAGALVVWSVAAMFGSSPGPAVTGSAAVMPVAHAVPTELPGGGSDGGSGGGVGGGAIDVVAPPGSNLRGSASSTPAGGSSVGGSAPSAADWRKAEEQSKATKGWGRKDSSRASSNPSPAPSAADWRKAEEQSKAGLKLDKALDAQFPPLSATGNDPSMTPEWIGLHCDYGSPVAGVLRGPDGERYQVVKPGDQGSVDGWSTIGVRRGELALGEPLTSFEEFVIGAGAAIGGGQEMSGWQSVGREQLRYLNDLPPPAAPFGRPPGGSAPQPSHEVPQEIRDGETKWRGRLDRVDLVGGAVDLAIGALQGVSNAQQLENNRHYASEVVYQEHVEGHRRAVIHIYQVQRAGSNVRVAHNYGKIGPGGGIERVRD